MSDLIALDADGWRALVDASFTLEEPGVELVLVEVQATGPADAQPRQPFSLIFRGPREPLEQAAYTFAHASAGRGAIFVVPVARSDAGVEYQAVFG